MAQSLIEVEKLPKGLKEGLVRSTKARHWSRYEKMQELGFMKILTWKCLTIRRPVLPVFLRAHNLIRDFYPEFLSVGVEGRQL